MIDFNRLDIFKPAICCLQETQTKLKTQSHRKMESGTMQLITKEILYDNINIRQNRISDTTY